MTRFTLIKKIASEHAAKTYPAATPLMPKSSPSITMTEICTVR